MSEEADRKLAEIRDLLFDTTVLVAALVGYLNEDEPWKKPASWGALRDSALELLDNAKAMAERNNGG